MDLRQMAYGELDLFVDALIAAGRVVGPQRRNGAVRFDELTRGSDYRFDYHTTTLPPKKLLLPPRERLLSFVRGETLQVTPPEPPEPLVLLGVHPCDLAALALLNVALTDTHKDPNWVARWESVTLIGADCTPDEWCFCHSMETLEPKAGFDLFFTDVGDGYVIRVGTEKGRALLEQHATVAPARDAAVAALAEFTAQKRRLCAKSLAVQKEKLPLLLGKLRDNPVWERRAKQCLACGSCNLVCPTCFCYDVWDEVALNGESGTRSRRYDGCLLKDFAAVASGENFREEQAARFRHRYFRKFEYLPTRVEGLYCVGCGRCSRQCVPGIADPVDVLNEALEQAGEAVTAIG